MHARNTKPESLIGNQHWYDWVWFDTPKDGQCQRGTKYVTIDFLGVNRWWQLPNP